MFIPKSTNLHAKIFSDFCDVSATVKFDKGNFILHKAHKVHAVTVRCPVTQSRSHHRKYDLHIILTPLERSENKTGVFSF